MKYLFLIIIYFSSSFLPSHCIKEILKSSLTNEHKFNFTLLIEDLNGYILYIIDSSKNKFDINIIHSKEIGNSIKMTFNDAIKTKEMVGFCGCDTCNNTELNFIVKFNTNIVEAICNSGSSLLFIRNKNTINRNHVYNVPVSLVNKSDTMLIMLGNKGPYIDENNILIPPARNQVKGCLISFFINDSMVPFNGTGTGMRPTCSKKCNNDTCNGGLCKEIYSSVSCNCSFTVLNGKYCNDSLKEYNSSGSVSFEKTDMYSELSVKISWNESLYKSQCLMEFTTNDKTITMFSYNDSLLIKNENNQIRISSLNAMEINFVAIDIRNGYLIYKTPNNSVLFRFHWYQNTRINVGFSETSNECEQYVGLYDFTFNSTKLRQKPRIFANVTILIEESFTKLFNSSFSKPLYKPSSANKILLFTLLPLLCLGFLSSILVILYMRRRRNKRRESTNTNKRNTMICNEISWPTQRYPNSGMTNYISTDNMKDYNSSIDEDTYDTLNL